MSNVHQVEGVECLNQEVGGGSDIAIPLPFYRGILFLKRYQCICGKSFWTEEKYRTHFRIENESEWFMEDA